MKFLPSPDFSKKLWASMDWADYVKLVRYNSSFIGDGEALVAAGRRYMWERWQTRSSHLYTPFYGIEKKLWVVKTYTSRRMIADYTIDYEKIDRSTFRVKASLPSHYEGCEEFFHFSTGGWIGTSPEIQSKNELLELEITPHSANAVIRFVASRRIGYRLRLNPISSRKKSVNELKECMAESDKQRKELERNSADLERVFNAVSDAVFVFHGTSYVRTNSYGEQLLGLSVNEDEAPFIDHLIQFSKQPMAKLPHYFYCADRTLKLRERIPLANESTGVYLLTVVDITETRELENQMLYTEELEQQRIARDLEEGLGRLLIKLREEAELLTDELEDPALLESAHQLCSYAQDCLDMGLQLSLGTAQLIHTESEFIVAVEELAHHYCTLFRFRCDVHMRECPFFDDQLDWTSLFRITQEAVRNAYRHSGGSRVVISLRHDQLEITDDGQGFAIPDEATLGLGLKSMRIRASQMNLLFSVKSVDGGGTTIALRMATELNSKSAHAL